MSPSSGSQGSSHLNETFRLEALLNATRFRDLLGVVLVWIDPVFAKKQSIACHIRVVASGLVLLPKHLFDVVVNLLDRLQGAERLSIVKVHSGNVSRQIAKEQLDGKQIVVEFFLIGSSDPPCDVVPTAV